MIPFLLFLILLALLFPSLLRLIAIFLGMLLIVALIMTAGGAPSEHRLVSHTDRHPVFGSGSQRGHLLRDNIYTGELSALVHQNQISLDRNRVSKFETLKLGHNEIVADHFTLGIIAIDDDASEGKALGREGSGFRRA